MNIRRVFYKIFRPIEVAAVIEELNKLETIISSSSELGWEMIKKEVMLAIISFPDVIVKSVRLGHIKPSEVAINMSRNLSTDMIISGRYHIYRGVLSMKGNELMSASNKISYLLVNRGLWDEKQLNEFNEFLKSEIKEVG